MCADFKIVTIGDWGIGKTCLNITIYQNEFPGQYIPTVQDIYAKEVTVDGRENMLDINDTGGGEDYYRLRPLSYPATNVFALCFDITNRESFAHIETNWLPELRYFNPRTPIVLVGNKRDLRDERKTDDYGMLYSASYWRDFVREEEGEALVKKHNLYAYVECSSLRVSGVDEVVATIVRAARANTTNQPNRTQAMRYNSREHKMHQQKMRRWGQVQEFQRKIEFFNWQNSKIEATELGEVVKPKTSAYGEELGKSLQESMNSADVKFTFSNKNQSHKKPSEDGQLSDSCTMEELALDMGDLWDRNPVMAHQVILSAASTIFKDIFCGDYHADNVVQKYGKLFEEITWNSASVSSNAESLDDHNTTRIVCIKLDKSISSGIFKIILQFLYAGNPGNLKSREEGFISELAKVAETFNLPELSEICQNVMQGDKSLNASITTWLNDKMGANMKEFFYNQTTLSDVQFLVEDHKIYAHKAVLVARCDVMAAMFGGAFKEGRGDVEVYESIPLPDVKLVPFLALLEYLYSDHVTFKEAHPNDLLVLADQYFVSRLVTLCEVEIQRRLREEIEKGTDVMKNVVQLTSWSKTYNAKQLHGWCLYHIGRHFAEFDTEEELLSPLDEDDQEKVMNHKRTLGPYLSKLKEYDEICEKYELAKQEALTEHSSKEKSSKCGLM